MPGSAWGSDRLGAKLWSMVRKGSLRIREEKALEFNNFFFQIYQRKWEIYFLGLPRSARAYNPWEGVLWSMVRREGRLGLWAPQKFSKSQLLVCGTCLGIPGSARAYNPWEGVLWSMVRREGRLGLWAPQKFSKSQLLVCGTCLGIPGSAWGSDCLGGRPWSMVGGGLKYLSRT